MNASFPIHCSECGLAWVIRLAECEVNQIVACPFCGNRHFGPQEARVERREAASAGRAKEMHGEGPSAFAASTT
ncbi:MAG: hypothetical protein NTW86_10755 [Candidatus Sumerlaeota bacterium]|nr:hypothetical protein [Candidatus Sumerlaeota bacterium]